MKTMISCTPTSKGVHSFYVTTEKGKFFLFQQDYRKGVHNYFKNGVRLDQAIDFSKGKYDTALKKTMQKLPMYIKYIEKEYGLVIMEQTRKKQQMKHGSDDRVRFCG